MPTRFFSPTSFWNTPLAADAPIDPRSKQWIDLLQLEPTPGLHINQDRWTIPVYEADEHTPLVRIHPRPVQAEGNTYDGRSLPPDRIVYRHGESFSGLVPLPADARPDPEADSHLAVVDYGRRLAWDMFAVRRREDGEYESYTGMHYSLDGDGIFTASMYPHLENGESIHMHGPGRAAGVPIIAGLIMHDELREGRISHKLAFATRFSAFQEFVYPATWTDGQWPGGLPEGCVLRLDPALDLSAFDLLPGERAVARALQEYGAVNVDVAGGTTLYAEHLLAKPHLSWDGLLRPHGKSGLRQIPLTHYHVIATGPTIRQGDHPKHAWLFKAIGREHPLLGGT